MKVKVEGLISTALRKVLEDMEVVKRNSRSVWLVPFIIFYIFIFSFRGFALLMG